MQINHNNKNLLLHSGRIYTQDPEFPFFQAMAIANGRIQWLGNNDDLYAIPSDRYEIIDLQGRTVLPGFCDAHMHFGYWAATMDQIDLDGCKSYREVLNKLKKAARNLKRGEWLTGSGWQHDQWKEDVWPHRDDLDKIVPDNPAALASRDEHSMWLNSTALKKLKLNDNTPDLEGGEISRDRHGRLTGILKEKATELAYRNIPHPKGQKAYKLLERAQQKCHELGITSLGSFDSTEGFHVLQEYHKKHGFKLRIGYYLPSRFLDEAIVLGLSDGLGDDNLKIAGVKFFADGALGSQTALMFKPYQGSDNCGIAQMTAEELSEGVKRAHKAGLYAAIHAIGDKANFNAYQAIKNALGKRTKNHRHRIEHCQILRKAEITKFAEIGLIGSVQPCHIIPDISIVHKYWGRRGRYAYPFKSMHTAGVPLAFGSDAPIEAPGPIWNIYCAVTRQPQDSEKAFYPVEKIGVEEAVRAHTFNGAYSLGWEKQIGSISIGKYADIVIMSGDIHIVSPEDIPKVRVIATIFNGEFVYGRENFAQW